eukprot:3180005-Rhodomonas_salina.3
MGKVNSAISLRPPYAMSGTAVLSACPRNMTQRRVPICLRVRRAMSGTDIAYGTKGRALWDREESLAGQLRHGPTRCYAMSGTDVVHAAMRCPVLT